MYFNPICEVVDKNQEYMLTFNNSFFLTCEYSFPAE